MRYPRLVRTFLDKRPPRVSKEVAPPSPTAVGPSRVPPLLVVPSQTTAPTRSELRRRSVVSTKADPDNQYWQYPVEYLITPTTYAFRVGDLVELLTAVGLAAQMAYLRKHHFWKYMLLYVGRDPLEGRSVNDEFDAFPTVSARLQSRLAKRPNGVKMLSGDFIEDSLYNPHYGYFNKEVEIFHKETPFDYTAIRDNDEFVNEWYRLYTKYDSKKDSQLWHTPTELFLPHYGNALARDILANHLEGPLVIYEMGGGNGTLMADVLAYVRQHAPEVYRHTSYRIIEILSKLAAQQKKEALGLKLRQQQLDPHKVQVINRSIFEWTQVVEEPCVFIALEVFDNFPHDVVRYDNTTGQPFQGYVGVTRNRDMFEFFSPELTPYTTSFLNLRDKSGVVCPHPLDSPYLWRRLRDWVYPYRQNLSSPEYVPTRLLQFFHVLKHKFPNHRLVASDFDALPEAAPGTNGPVVQTVINQQMVTANTYMVHQGFFDIMFPTNFELAKALYGLVTGKTAEVSTHREYLTRWADLGATTTKRGENPMVDFYTNAKFITTAGEP